MDYKLINKEIKRIIKPFLSKNNFVEFTSRSAWRYRNNQIDVINFQSFNSFLSQNLGCTTFSFSVNLGVYFKDIPAEQHSNNKKKKDYLRPEEYECHFRNSLLKNLNQPELSRKDIWYIDEEGKYLEQSLIDVLQQMSNYALPWFDRFENKDEVLRTLLEDDEINDGTFGFGNNPSPIRSYQTGYIALSLGKYSIAKKALNEAIESCCFDDKQLKIDLESIN